MTEKVPNDSVQDEQFGEGPKNPETTEGKLKETPAEEVTDAEEPVSVDQPEEKEEVASVETSEDKSDESASVETTEDKSDESASVETTADKSEESASAENTTDKSDESDPDFELPPVDYSSYSRKELVETLELLLNNRPTTEIKDNIDRIRITFYRKFKEENEQLRKAFVNEGGKIEDFEPAADEDEERLKTLLERYREKRNDQNRVQEAEKHENLARKNAIIENIKDLVNREESINKTFQEFRSLQSEWHNVGMVPQGALKDMWENYHLAVEIFYDYIKINKELRDLDIRKNMELKIGLCEKAEALLLEANPVNAFRELQELHNRWREVGPVPRESKEELWERFKEATSAINKRHHEYFETQKDEQRKNLDAKMAICEKVEEINKLELSSFKDFDNRSNEIVELQKVWRTIGFAPKKQNKKIYQRFRDACDQFFEKKRLFYAENKGIQVNNLELKTELCVKAEALQESTDWKGTTDALIKLQKEWKEVGPVPRKQSEKVWKRFRKACDTFFNNKSKHFSSVDSSYEANLEKKLKLVDELEVMQAVAGTQDIKEQFERLKGIQREWAETGFVPIAKKDELTAAYRKALNAIFEKLKLSDEEKNLLRYRNKVENMKGSNKPARKGRGDRDKFITRIKQLESDIVLWENNIGFFAKSKKADAMIKEVEERIENAKNTIKSLEEKINIIDNSGIDD